jgi:hypothetical protein
MKCMENRKQFPGGLKWLLVSLIVWSPAAASGYAPVMVDQSREPWEHQPKKSRQ